MSHTGESEGAKNSCKSPKGQLVQIGEPLYWKSVEELHNGPRFTGEFPVAAVPHLGLCSGCPARATLCSHPPELTGRIL